MPFFCRGVRMSNLSSVAAVLRSLQTAQAVSKEIRDAGFLGNKDDLRRSLADLSGSVSEAKMQLTLLQEVLAGKDQEIQKLQLALAYRGTLRRRGDGYYKTQDGRPYGQPYCSYCWEHEQKTIHLHNKILSKDVRVCGHCKNEYLAARTPYIEADVLV